MEEEAWVSLERTWVGISAKMSPLHNPDKRGDVNDPTIEKISFTVEKIIEGDMAHSV